MNMDTIVPPWTAEQVEAMNQFQHERTFHPFTCENRNDGKHGDGEGILIATPDGWICPHCDYKQGWAHGFMAGS